MEKIKEILVKWCTDGIKLPFLHDPETKKPSITLFFPYASFTIASISVIALHFKPKTLFIPTSVSIAFWVLSVVLYRLRKLDKAKFDLDDKVIELNSDSRQD